MRNIHIYAGSGQGQRAVSTLSVFNKLSITGQFSGKGLLSLSFSLCMGKNF